VASQNIPGVKSLSTRFAKIEGQVNVGSSKLVVLARDCLPALLHHPLLQAKQFAELPKLVLVVAVEKDLVKARKGKDILVPIKLDSYGYYAAA